MKFRWPWKKSVQENPRTSEDSPIDNPFIIFELVDGVNLHVACGWPENGDVAAFAQMLNLLNTGEFIGPEMASILAFGNGRNQHEQVAKLLASLEQFISKRKHTDGKRPLVLPSRVIQNQIKLHQH